MGQWSMARKTEDDIFRARQAREGRKGGIATLKKHGSAHYVRAAKKRWAKKTVDKKG